MKITRREAIDAIKGMFEVNTGNPDNKSVLNEKENDTATFMLDKRKYEREEIINKLCDFFSDVSIIDGRCTIGRLSLVFTIVSIEEMA